MKQDNINYFMVGTLVLFAFTVLTIVLLQLAGQNGETDSYYVTYDNVTGIQHGTAVTHGGYQIGQVKNIKPVNDTGQTRFKVELAVRQGWQLPQHSIARVVSPGLLADPQIDILAGDSQDYLPVGASLEGREAANLFAALDSVAYEIQDLSQHNVKPLIQNLSRNIDNISGRVNQLSDDLGGSIPRVTQGIENLLANLNQSATQLQTLLGPSNQQHISSFVGNADTMSKNLVSISAGFDKNIQQIEDLLQSSGKIFDDNSADIRQSVVSLRDALGVVTQNIDNIVYNLNTASRNLSEFSYQIRANPAVLLGSEPPADIAEGK